MTEQNRKKTKNLIVWIAAILVSFLVLVPVCMWLSSLNDGLNAFFTFLSNSSDYTREEEEVKSEEIAVTMQEDGYTKLVIGDSVAYFLFNRLQEYNDEYLLDGTNRPFTLAGQYVQVREFLDHHAQATDIYMFESKGTWQAILDPQCGYQNVVVPMLHTGTLQDLNADTLEEIDRIYTPLLANPTVAHIYMYSNMNHKIILNGLLEYNARINGIDTSATYNETVDQVSPLAAEYFPQIMELCEERGVTLHLVHDPLADTEENHAAVETERQMMAEAGFEGERIDGYFDSVSYYPPEDFFDGVHFVVEDELMNSVIAEISDREKILQGLVLE